MKFITPKFEIVEQAPEMKGMLEHIERAGRTCYKSHDKITEGSAEKFVERMKSNQHLSVLEHGTVYLSVLVVDPCIVGNHEHIKQQEKFNDFITKYSHNKFSVVKVNQYNCAAFITTNYRVIVENGWEDDLKHVCWPTMHHEKRVTVRFNTDIGISREFNRHRVNSISEESTRYCNYSKGKFGGELSVVPPVNMRERTCEERVLNFYYKNEMTDTDILEEQIYYVLELLKKGKCSNGAIFDDMETWLFATISAQWAYMRLTQQFGWSAQEARSILPLCTATELVHTAFVSDWLNFFQLRCDSHAHPMAQELAIPLREEFVKRGFIKE